MFGYVTINRGELKVRELETYESYYCGLCRVLKDRYGLAGCTMLNYDMTFLGMLLSSLYEEKEEPAKRVCRPGFKRPLLKKKSKKERKIKILKNLKNISFHLSNMKLMVLKYM